MATRTGFFVSDIGSLLGSSGHEGGADGADKQIQRESAPWTQAEGVEIEDLTIEIWKVLCAFQQVGG